MVEIRSRITLSTEWIDWWVNLLYNIVHPNYKCTNTTNNTSLCSIMWTFSYPIFCYPLVQVASCSDLVSILWNSHIILVIWHTLNKGADCSRVIRSNAFLVYSLCSKALQLWSSVFKTLVLFFEVFYDRTKEFVSELQSNE